MIRASNARERLKSCAAMLAFSHAHIALYFLSDTISYPLVLYNRGSIPLVI